MLKTAKGLLLSLLLLILGACATKPTVDDERSKALAMAAENGSALLVMAGFPLQYYCAHNHWPDKLVPPAKSRPLFAGVRHLKYHQDGEEYAAKFQIQSFLPGDKFVVNWHMLILPPDHITDGVQTVPIALTAKKYDIMIPFDYEYDCRNRLTA